MSRRWTVLAAGTFAQATYSAIWFGVAVMAPFLRHRYHLSLGETGVLISASLGGSVVSLVPWGYATDRFGERIVLIAGLGSCGSALVAAALVHGFWPLLALLVLAGMLGASVQSASGRAVMAAFPPEQRGLALGIRQTAIPIAGFVVSLALPHVARVGIGWGFAALGVACLFASALGGSAIADVDPPPEDEGGAAPLRDERLWRIAVGSALVVAPQMCVVGFTVLLLHDHRGLSAGRAAAVLAVVQALGIAGRIGAGRWSDVVRSRLRPLRVIALADAALVLACAAVLDRPLALLLPLLVVAGVLAMSWNGLAFAAAIELVGHRRSGVAIGLQQSVLNGFGAVYPGVFGALVGATSWTWGFLAVAVLPLLGHRVLRGLPG
ncbi:MAG: MFS transporter [Gaiellaceae bacterium]